MNEYADTPINGWRQIQASPFHLWSQFRQNPLPIDFNFYESSALFTQERGSEALRGIR